MSTFAKNIVTKLLLWEARLVLKRYKPKIIAVTGSVGKTATKDGIFAALSGLGHVRKSDKSFNSAIGVPLTILGSPNAWHNPVGWAQNLLDGLILAFYRAPYPEWLILEVGADRPGDIKSVAKWLVADVVVVTNVPEVPVHVEYFNSSEEVLEEKASLLNALKPGGTAILYGDSARTALLRERLPEGTKVATFGWDETCSVRGTDAEALYRTTEGGANQPLGMRFLCVTEGAATVPLTLTGAIGTHAALPLLVGLAVGRALGVEERVLVEGLERYVPPVGRMRLLDGRGGSTLIDDTYNASPSAVVAGLETLRGLVASGRKIVALGDMLELGRKSVEEHRKIGGVAASVADLLVIVGVRARDIAQGALDAGFSEDLIWEYEDASHAGEAIADVLVAGDLVYAKGSQSIRMERAVEHCLADPTRAHELLVRQDPEWLAR